MSWKVFKEIAQHFTKIILTLNEPLSSLDGVVAHTVVSAGENNSLFIEEAQIVAHACPQTEYEMGLCNNSSHYLVEFAVF